MAKKKTGPFDLIWCHPPLPDGIVIDTPTRKQPDRKNSLAEAGRLARLHGGDYCIMGLVGVVRAEKGEEPVFIPASEYKPPKKPTVKT